MKRQPQVKPRRNIRTLPANRMQYLLENYPEDCRLVPAGKGMWFEETVLKAMQAAYEAGRRDCRKAQE